MLNWLFNMKLKHSLLLITTLVAIVVSFLTYSYNIDLATKSAKQYKIELIKERTELIKDAIESLNSDDICKLFNTLSKNKELVHSIIIDKKGEIVHSIDRDYIGLNIKNILNKDELNLYEKTLKIDSLSTGDIPNSENLYSITSVKISSTKNSATLFQEYDISKLIDNIIFKERLNASIPIFLFLIAIFGIGTFVYFRFTKRISDIIDTTNSCSKSGDLSQKIGMSGSDEIAKLAQSIDSMIDRISKSQLKLKSQNSELSKTVKLLDEYKRAIDESNIVSKSNLKGTITYVNDKFCKVTGYSEDEVLGKPHSIVRHPDNSKEIFKDLWKSIQSKKTWKHILKNRKKNGDYYYVDITILPILDERGDIFEYIAIRHDVTELMDKKEELERIANSDSLTKVGNRFKLINDIENFKEPMLAIIDIDRFSEINDFYGDNIGDSLLIVFTDKVNSLIEKDYFLYRVHGDEFAILTDSSDKNRFINSIEKLIDGVKKNQIEFSNKSFSLQVTASISFESKNRLISTAHMAIKFAKRNRKYLVIYSDSLELNREYENNIDWTNRIKKALKEDRIVPFFQPIYNNKTKKIDKYEALVRLIEEDGKVISPFFFLDIAKRSKQYIDITKRVIDKSCRAFKDSDLEFSINLTVEDILNSELIEYLKNKIKEYKVNSRVVFELVESEGIENFSKVREFIEMAKNCGCKVAIDDFGTGYSNFEYLLKLNTDYIKIDGSMIQNIDKDRDSFEIVKIIVDFAKKRNLKTVAEFVSSQEVFDIVNSLEIDYSQGYYISEPKDVIK